MNLVEQFMGLDVPTGTDGKIFNAEPISEYPNFRIAVDLDGHPVLLFSILSSPVSTYKNFKLKYLSLLQNIRCKITEYNNISYENFSVVTFTSNEPFLQTYFLKIAETFIQSLSRDPSAGEISDTLNKFVEIFQVLDDTPTKTIQGLWAELLVIDCCKLTPTLLSFWHNSPDDKFDFNAGSERIEVKSSLNYERKHSFTSEQLSPPMGSVVIVASVLMKHDTKGKNIQDLIDNIASKVDDWELVEKLNSVVCKTLGSSLENGLTTKFDYEFSKLTLNFFHHKDIAKICEQDIPDEVTNVRFTSDLSRIKGIELDNFSGKSALLGAL